MDTMILEFAGVERPFRLRAGEMMDLEQACGKVGLGTIYKRFATTDYFLSDVRSVLKLSLVGGGMPPVEAEDLVRQQVEIKPIAVLAAVATDVILAAMVGVEATKDQGETEGLKMDPGKIFASFVRVGISPEQVREMRYADFVNLLRAMSKGDNVDPPSEHEFAEMLAAWDERNVSSQ